MTDTPASVQRDAERLAKQQAALDRDTEVRASQPDWLPEVTRLAVLSPIDYDQQRKSVAEVLGIRVDTLDREVARVRGGEVDDGQGRPVTFIEPEPWPEPVNGTALLDDLAATAGLYLVLPTHGFEVLALWVLLTYLADAVSVLPILVLHSPEKGCGKTTVMEFLSRLCWRARTTSNIHPAGLFRFIEKFQPTFLIDEGDSFLKGSDELRGIINSGHTRTSASVTRCVGDDYEPRDFSTWCPKALAAIGRLPDTIEDRAVILRMRRKGPGESVASLRHAGPDGFEALARRCRRFADDHRIAIGEANPTLPPTLTNRAADNWEPLCAIADAAGGRWPDLARTVAAAFVETQTGESLKTTLLTDIRDLFRNRGVDRLASADIVATLTGMEERPWPESSRGKPMTPRQLAGWLGDFGIKSRSIRLESGGTPKGYHLEQFEDAFARYLTPETPQRHNPGAARLPEDLEAPHECTLVADETGPESGPGLTCGGVADGQADAGRADFARVRL